MVLLSFSIDKMNTLTPPIFFLTLFCLIFGSIGCKHEPGAAPKSPDEAHLMTGLGHGGKVFAVAISPDSKYILTGSADYTARLWSAESRQELRRIEVHQGAVTAVAFSHDGKNMLTAGEDGKAYIWDVATGEQLHELVGHTGAILGAAFSGDGSIIATAGEDKTVRLWNLTTEEVRLLQGHEDFVESVAFSKDGKNIISSSLDRTVGIWQASTGKLLRRAEVHESEVWDAIAAPSGNILSAGVDRVVKIWNIVGKDSVAVYQTLKGPRGGIENLTLSSDGQIVAAASRDKSVYVWNAQDGKFRYELKGHTAPVWAVAIAPNKQFIVSGGTDKSVRIWSLTNGALIGELGTAAALVTAVASAPSQMVTWKTSREVTIWRKGNTERHILGKGDNPTAQLSPNGNFVLATDSLNTSTLWQSESGQAIRTYKNMPALMVKKAAVAPDGKLIAIGDMDGMVNLIEAQTGQLLRRIGKEGGAVNHVAFSADGQKLVAGRSDRSVLVMAVGSGTVLHGFQNMKGLISDVAISSNGQFVAATSKDSTTTIWNVDTGMQSAQVKGVRPVERVSFSADGSSFLTIDRYGHTSIWSNSGSTKGELAQLGITNAVFTADGRYILSGNIDGEVKLWTTDSGYEAFSLRTLEDNQWAIIASNGKFTASNKDQLKGAYWVQNGQAFPFESKKADFYDAQIPNQIWGEKQ